MNGLVKALAVIGWAVAFGVVVFISIMSVYLFKQARWESNLKRYRKDPRGVINGQGHLITTPGELLDELIGIEERIAK